MKKSGRALGFVKEVTRLGGSGRGSARGQCSSVAGWHQSRAQRNFSFRLRASVQEGAGAPSQQGIC